MIDVQFPFSWIMDWHNECNKKIAMTLLKCQKVGKQVIKANDESQRHTHQNVQACLSPGYSLPSRAFDLVAFPEKPIEDVCFLIAK